MPHTSVAGGARSDVLLRSAGGRVEGGGGERCPEVDMA